MYVDLVEQVTATTGTGTYTVSGTIDGRQTFATAYTDGQASIPYVVTDDLTNFEIGLGTWTEATNELARTVILASSNAGAAVNWGAGNKRIYVSPSAATSMAPARHNFTSAVAPAVTDDNADGYGFGSIWVVNTGTASDRQFYVCVDASTGAADWRKLLGEHIVGARTKAYVSGMLSDSRSTGVGGGAQDSGISYHSSGSFVSNHAGDNALAGVGALTTDATPRHMAHDDDYATLGGHYVDVGCTAITGTVQAVNTANGDSKVWTVEAVLKIDSSGVVTVVSGAAPTQLYADAGAASWSIAVTSAAAYECTIQVTGAAATNISWNGSLLFSAIVDYSIP